MMRYYSQLGLLITHPSYGYAMNTPEPGTSDTDIDRRQISSALVPQVILSPARLFSAAGSA